MKAVFAAMAMVVVGLCGCTTYGDYGTNDSSAPLSPLCEQQSRDMASHPPLPQNASEQDKQVRRDYYMSKVCQEETDRGVGVTFPSTSRP